ncbi:tripartite tricarboxylate transporter substrate binding protein [Aquabacterium sp. J223]|uniref:tripartite tricarboxylate transporter substrate binding protein n=1 Tax=Aquabacterium sp. J223 TaxID=2898431 RepID=UPI0021ADE29D|nr:tripartite tricarboxylate transporter substrate binding protein [Aquabacterium sp. J223]UUX95295.1 tripartite tricarboxylate transporter substrate binding protein [Aquabacterium sp. J223]
MKRFSRAAQHLAGLLLLALATGAAAQGAWPNKPVRLVVPYPPGGGTDAVVRVLAPKLSAALGQQVLIENRGGASTIIGSDLVAKAAPDGYTFGVITDSHSINPNFHPSLPYDSMKSFKPVGQLVTVPFALVTSSSSPYKSLQQFIAGAKAAPGQVPYASIGDGSPHYLAMEWMRLLAGIQLVHVPYKGVGPALTDVMGGQVQAMFTGLSTAIPQAKAGRLTLLAVSSPKRDPTLPDVPAVAEAPGLSEFEYRAWYGVVAPTGTPDDIANRMSTELRKALTDPEVVERLQSLGVDPEPSTPAQFAQFLQRDAVRMTKIIKATGAKGGG